MIEIDKLFSIVNVTNEVIQMQLVYYINKGVVDNGHNKR